MKKSLFAIAAVTAFAGAAQAQSSVTVYGILDAGYVGGNQRVAGPATVTKGTWNQFQAQGAESTNRIGFRGREDMGGGTAAIFTFELNLNPNPSTAPTAGSAAGTPNTTSQNWTPEIRQAFAGIAQKGMGDVRVGTQNTLIWQLAAPMTVGQLNNIAGSVINATNVGSPSALGAVEGNGSAGLAFTNRTQRTLQVASERMSGLQGKAMYVLGDSTTTQTQGTGGNVGYLGGVNNYNGWGLSLDYTFKKFQAAVAYQSFNADNPYAANQAQVNAASGYTLNNPTPVGGSGFGQAGANIKDNQTFAAATYDFGILKAYVNYVNRKASSQQNSNAYLSRSAQEIGVRSFVTQKVEGWASIGNGRYSAFGPNTPTANITGFQLGSNYWLSKRTNLYAIYGQVGTSSTSVGAANINNYAIGARHTF